MIATSLNNQRRRSQFDALHDGRLVCAGALPEAVLDVGLRELRAVEQLELAVVPCASTKGRVR